MWIEKLVNQVWKVPKKSDFPSWFMRTTVEKFGDLRYIVLSLIRDRCIRFCRHWKTSVQFQIRGASRGYRSFCWSEKALGFSEWPKYWLKTPGLFLGSDIVVVELFISLKITKSSPENLIHLPRLMVYVITFLHENRANTFSFFSASFHRLSNYISIWICSCIEQCVDLRSIDILRFCYHSRI